VGFLCIGNKLLKVRLDFSLVSGVRRQVSLCVFQCFRACSVFYGCLCCFSLFSLFVLWAVLGSSCIGFLLAYVVVCWVCPVPHCVGIYCCLMIVVCWWWIQLWSGWVLSWLIVCTECKVL